MELFGLAKPSNPKGQKVLSPLWSCSFLNSENCKPNDNINNNNKAMMVHRHYWSITMVHSRRQKTILQILLAVSFLISFASSQPYKCFPANGNAALRAAVIDYIKIGRNSNSGKTYGPIDRWCVSKVKSFANVFKGQTKFNQPLRWITSSATTFESMFEGCTAFNQDLSTFDTSRATNLRRMFFNAKAFTGRGLAKWNLKKVTNMVQTFVGTKVNTATAANSTVVRRWTPTCFEPSGAALIDAVKVSFDSLGQFLPSLDATKLFLTFTPFASPARSTSMRFNL